MDTLLEDQTIQAVLGRADFNGLENASLDFSQLEDYINDEADGNEKIYFTEALGTSDLKLLESSRLGIKLNANSNSNANLGANSNRNLPPGSHILSTALQSPPTQASRTANLNICLNSDYSKNSHTLNGPGSRTSSILHPLSHQSNIDPNLATQSHRHQVSLFNNKNSQPHHLPESPPDSGSEPPYSPPNDENRPNGIHLTGPSHSSHSHHTHSHPHHHSNLRTSEMIHSDSADNIKHFVHYPETSIKHLPPPVDLNLTVNPAHHQTSQHTTHHLTPLHPFTSNLHSDGTILTHLEASLLSNPMTLQNSPISSSGHGNLPQIYNSGDTDYSEQGCGDRITECSHSHKKRKVSDSPKTVDSINLINIKQEPGGVSPEPPNNSSNLIPSNLDDEYGFDYNASHEDVPVGYFDSTYQCIRFQAFQQNTWNVICDTSLKELPPPNYRVDADKGFNFSNADDAFVCQKKNHFQITVHIQPIGDPQYVKTPETVKKIDNFYIHFYGVKVESLSQTIKVEQSQSDRSKKPFHPVLTQLTPDQVTKTTVGRLHFNETTSNNMRKKGKPNPDQRYFYLVVSLCAHVGDQSYPIISYSSERIIVRASNPGQFENDLELSWQKGYTPESIYHAGRVGINTDRPDESLVVHGNVKVTGHIIQPSDSRAKTNIEEMNTKEQLKNVSNIRVVRYKFTPEFAQQVGLTETEINGTGIIAQEVQQILPDAVREAGDVILPSGERIENFLVVNKERIFMENVGAVKELCKVTDNLETRIDELERMNNRLRKINRFDSIKSIMSTSSVTSISTITCTSSNYSGGNHGHSKRVRCSHKNYKNHRKCSQHDSDNNKVCTNRFMQSIIMILVLIMAFCLASIVTLYILDYPRRHSSSLNLHTSSQLDPNYDNTVNNTPSPSNFFSLSTRLPRPENKSFDSTRQSVFGYNIMTNKARDKEISQKPNSIPILKPRLIGTPPSCLEPNSMVSSCFVHCCINPSVINRAGLIDVVTYKDIDHHNIVKSENTEDKFINSIKNFNPSSALPTPSSEATTSFAEIKKTTPMTNLFKSNELNSPELDSPLSPRLIDDSPIHAESGAHINNLGADGLSDTSLTKQNLTKQNDASDQKSKLYLTESFDDTNKYGTYHNDPSSMIYSKAEEYREKRETRETMVNQQAPLYRYNVMRRDLSKSIESIKLLELNATIGREFCTTWQCVQGNGPSFTYLVSISKYMPFEFVTIQFSLNSPMKVDHCEYKEKPLSCPSLPPGADDVPHSYHRPLEHLPVAESSHSFRIPIGLYLKSTYVFRVLSKERNFETPCSLPESAIGLSFIEFKLVFTRKCDK